MAATSPVDDSTLGSVQMGTGEPVDVAISVTADAAPELRDQSVSDRADALRAGMDALERPSETIVDAMAREVGKPVDEAGEDLESAIDSGRSDAEDAVRLSGEVTPSKFDDRLNFTQREPDGPAAVVTPRNYPVDHEAVRLVTFTGSAAVGQRIAASAAQRSVQAVLELGGEDQVLILDDADLDRAADAIVTGSNDNCGQSCSGTERVIVTRGVDDEVVDRVTERTAGLVVGDPLDRSTDVGPPIDEDVRETVREQIADGVDAGARVTTGGTVGDRYCEPTVLADVTPDMRVPTAQTVGPVRPILHVADVDEAIEVANDSKYGFQTAVFTESIRLAHRAVDERRSGGGRRQRSQQRLGAPVAVRRVRAAR